MYRIAVLTDQEQAGRDWADQIVRFCSGKGIFPQIERYLDQERFFEGVQQTAPTNAVIALPGVAGLNAAEHLRALLPACSVIWCSDLDFSLQAFRLRVKYFILEPVTGETLRQGLNAWLEEKNTTMRRTKP